jgi:hypothetical protein
MMNLHETCNVIYSVGFGVCFLGMALATYLDYPRK